MDSLRMGAVGIRLELQEGGDTQFTQSEKI